MTTFDKIAKIISSQLEVDLDKIQLDTNIVEDLGADSIDVFELVTSIEDEFEIEIDEDAITNFKTVKDVVDAIDAQ